MAIGILLVAVVIVFGPTGKWNDPLTLLTSNSRT
jgi:hypothetical protein